MILADIGQYQALKGYVIELTQKELKREILENQHNLVNFNTLFTEKEINNAITFGIRRTGNMVFMQTDGLNGQILRALEYGTSNTKALHLVTKAIRKVIGGRV